MYKNSRHHLLIQSTSELGLLMEEKVRVKTRPADWQNTQHPVILPLSIYSALYQGSTGDSKIASLLKVVTGGVKGKVTVLLCEGAHIHSMSLKYPDLEKAKQACHHDALLLLERYNAAFQGCDIAYWDTFVTQDENYHLLASELHKLYQTNNEFQELIKTDVANSSKKDFALQPANQSLYYGKLELDLLEQCIYLLVAAKKGYKFEFYIGKRTNCVDYINTHFLPPNHRLVRVNVTIGTPQNNRIV